MSLRLSKTSILKLLDKDVSRPFTSYDLIDIASKHGAEFMDDSKEPQITSILERLEEKGEIKKKVILKGTCGNSCDITVYWIKGSDPQIHTRLLKRRLEDIPSSKSIPKKKIFKPFRTPLISITPKVQDHINKSSTGVDLHSSKTQELLNKKRLVENDIKTFTARKKKMELAMLYKKNTTKTLEQSIESWRSVALMALESLQGFIGPVDSETLINKIANNTDYEPNNFSTPRMLTIPEISSILGIDYAILDPSYEP